MKAHLLTLALFALAAVPSCLADDAAPAAAAPAASTASADTTFRYLKEIGRVRTMVNADNKAKIPRLLQAKGPEALVDEVKALAGYRQSLDRLDPTDVDPDAVVFRDNFAKIIDAYKTLCGDSAELFREIKNADATAGAARILSPRIELQLNDTLGAVDSLLGILDASKSDAKAPVQPTIDKVRSDLAALRAAKAVHHDFTQKVKSEFTDRYQGTDWTDKDVLP